MQRKFIQQQQMSRLEVVMGTQHPINGQQSGAHRAVIACHALFRCPFVLPVWCQHCCGGLHPPCQTFPNFLELTDIPSYSSRPFQLLCKGRQPQNTAKATPSRQRHNGKEHQERYQQGRPEASRHPGKLLILLADSCNERVVGGKAVRQPESWRVLRHGQVHSQVTPVLS